MAKVLITEGYLSDIADAIREKKSSEDTYTPAEMADAIESIQTGITPTGTKSVSITSNGTTTEDVTNYASVEIAVNVPSSSPTLVTKNITENGTYNASSDNADGYSSVTVNVQGSGGYTADDWADRTKPSGVVTVPSDVTEGSNNLYWQYLLARRINITKVNFPYTGTVPTGFCLGCSGMTEMDTPNVTSCFGSSFSATGLVYAVMPKMKSFQGNSGFQDCKSLLGADFGGEAKMAQSRDGFYGSYTLNGCSNLKTLVLRGSEVWRMSNVNTFNGTPFASGGTGGTLYVPEDLLSSYQSTGNWATILGYANNQIKSIESTHTDPNAVLDLTTHYIDGSSIPT